MATGNVRDIINAHGRLIKDPTDTTTAFPFGGTELGLAHTIRFLPREKKTAVVAEEYGGTIIEYLGLGADPVLLATTRGYDADMMQQIFTNTAQGAVTDERLINYSPASDTFGDRPGKILNDRGFTLMFAPTDTTHPFIVMFNAVGILEEAAEIPLAKEDEFGIIIEFHVLPGTAAPTGRSYQIGRLEDLTL